MWRTVTHVKLGSVRIAWSVLLVLGCTASVDDAGTDGVDTDGPSEASDETAAMDEGGDGDGDGDGTAGDGDGDGTAGDGDGDGDGTAGDGDGTTGDGACDYTPQACLDSCQVGRVETDHVLEEGFSALDVVALYDPLTVDFAWRIDGVAPTTLSVVMTDIQSCSVIDYFGSECVVTAGACDGGVSFVAELLLGTADAILQGTGNAAVSHTGVPPMEVHSVRLAEPLGSLTGSLSSPVPVGGVDVAFDLVQLIYNGPADVPGRVRIVTETGMILGEST